VLRQLVATPTRRGARVRWRAIPECDAAGAAIAADIAALRLIFYPGRLSLRDGAPLTYETAMAKV
jgi:hypothetical protein